MKFMYWGVAEELFPIVGSVLPKGWQVGVMPENQPEQLLQRAEILRVLPSHDIASVLDLTIDDDNIGMVPQLTTKTLHGLMRHLVTNGWSGFVARERFPMDHDPALGYLARAAWEPETEPEAVARRQFRAICGDPCVSDMLEVIRKVESATVYLGDQNRNFSKERPDTISKYWVAGPVPPYLAQVRVRYREGLQAAERARHKSTPEGRSYIDFWAGRLQFAIGFTDMVTAVHEAANAAAEDRRTEGAAKLDVAIGRLRDGLDAYARVVRSQSDRGAIAMLDEFGYRYLQAKRAEIAK
jgi:hypothetical protein